jgi:hypothetical protein
MAIAPTISEIAITRELSMFSPINLSIIKHGIAVTTKLSNTRTNGWVFQEAGTVGSASVSD